ncbi:MAG TPA: nuclear transport factor 2 family protein [Streptosporangiaceae bacterium]|jgi:ketosteroid isomerase-like protein
MTTAELVSALHEVEARLAGAQLVAEFAHGIDNRDLDRAMAAWLPTGVLTFAPGTVLTGHGVIRARLEQILAASAEMYHWYTNLSITVTGDAGMHIECRIAALSRTHSGSTVREVGSSVFECVKEAGDWLIASEAVTIQHRETAA